MAPEAGQPEKPAALKPLAPAKAAFRQALAGGRPPSGGKRAGRPQQAPRNGNGARAAMPGQRTAEDRPAIQVEEGTTVAAAVLDRAGGETRTTARKHDGRGPYCHMGVCYECLMEIDGVPNQQSCLIPVREGMSVKRQSGAPSFRTEENK